MSNNSDYNPFIPCAESKKKLKMLRDYMDGPARELNKLNMYNYYYNVDSTGYDDYECTKETYECATTMCLAGHGPLAGIPMPQEYIKSDGMFDWFAYSFSLFGVDYKEFSKILSGGFLTINGKSISAKHIYAYHQFLFGAAWRSSYDECVARLDLALNYKAPLHFQYTEEYAN